jgi:hypothetical protein
MSNFVSKMISHCSKVGWEDWARELEAWDVEGVVLGILEVSRDFYRAGGVQPLSPVVKTNPRGSPTPLQKKINPTPEGNYTLEQQSAVVKIKK